MRANRRSVMRAAFTPKIWNRWLERLNGPDPADPQYRYLADGIAEFRRRCAEREKGVL